MAVSVYPIQTGDAKLLVHAISKTVSYTIKSIGIKTTLGIFPRCGLFLPASVKEVRPDVLIFLWEEV